MWVEVEIRGYIEEGNLHLDLEEDSEEILIGKHRCTVEAIEILVHRIVNRQLREPAKVVLDVGGYRRKRADSIEKMALRLGERAKEDGKAITVGPFNAQDRRIIHLALQQDGLVKTESIGEGTLMKISILPRKSEGEGNRSLE
jgi:spoIIIJ-associated protein